MGPAPAGAGAPPAEGTLTASVPAGLPSEDLYVPEALAAHGPVVAGWGAFLAVGLLLAVLAFRWRQPAPTLPAQPDRVARRDWILALVGTLTVAVVASWPMAVTGDLVQRNFDGFGSAWLLWHAAQSGGFVEQVDTWIYLVLGLPLQFVVGPARAYGLATVLGLWGAGMSAWWVARSVFRLEGLGALAACVAWCANPLVGTALVEGHGGLLVGVGLPLLLGALHREPGDKPWRWAGLVVGAGVLCALQSGYFAILAGVLTLAWCAWQRRPLWRVVAIVALPALVFILWVVAQTRQSAGMQDFAWYVWHLNNLPPPNVVSLDTLAGIPPDSAGLLHATRRSLILALLVVGVALPLLRGDRTARGLALLALFGAFLALGPRLRLTCSDADGWYVALPYAWVAAYIKPVAVFRFPARWLWLYYLAAGMGAAWVISACRRHWLRGALLGVVLIEALVVGARPWEDRSVLSTAPSAYNALTSQDEVLDLWPPFGAHHPQGVALKELSCYYQVHHGAGLPMACLSIHIDESELLKLDRAVVTALLEDRDPGLQHNGITAVALHADAFDLAHRSALRQRLEARYGPAVATSDDAGERVEIYRVSQPSSQDPP